MLARFHVLENPIGLLNTIVFSPWSSVACLPNQVLVDRSMVGMFLTI